MQADDMKEAPNARKRTRGQQQSQQLTKEVIARDDEPSSPNKKPRSDYLHLTQAPPATCISVSSADQQRNSINDSIKTNSRPNRIEDTILASAHEIAEIHSSKSSDCYEIDPGDIDHRMPSACTEGWRAPAGSSIDSVGSAIMTNAMGLNTFTDEYTDIVSYLILDDGLEEAIDIHDPQNTSTLIPFEKDKLDPFKIERFGPLRNGRIGPLRVRRFVRSRKTESSRQCLHEKIGR